MYGKGGEGEIKNEIEFILINRNLMIGLELERKSENLLEIVKKGLDFEFGNKVNLSSTGIYISIILILEIIILYRIFLKKICINNWI